MIIQLKAPSGNCPIRQQDVRVVAGQAISAQRLNVGDPVVDEGTVATSFLAKIIVALIAGLVFGHGDQDSGAVGRQDQISPGVRRSFKARPTGKWLATGHVLTAEGVANRSVGEVLHRRWRFETLCGEGRCHALLLRTSSSGIQSATLRFPRPNLYLAEFGNIQSTCEVRPGYNLGFTVTFSIWWTKHHSHLVAEEMGRVGEDPRCPGGGERIRWTAHRRHDKVPEGTEKP